MHASSMLKALAAVLAVSSPALAELSVTAPIAGTTCTGGQTCQVSWGDNGEGVSLAQQGNCTIALYTGGAQQQTFLQPIAFPDPINVTTTGSIIFTPDPTVGPNGSDYFIRFSSVTLTQTGSANPYLSFSAKFTLSGMTGTFNSTVQAQISSQASSTPSSTRASTSSTRSSSSTSRTSTSTSTTGAGLKNGVNGALVAGAAFFAGLSLF